MVLCKEPKEQKTRMTMEEVIQRIEDHDTVYEPVDLSNCLFEEEVELRGLDIQYSLDFQYSVFQKTLSMHSATMHGSYIELTGTELRGGVYFTSLKSSRWDGYGIFLRNAKVFGDIGLNGAGPISTLVMYDNEYFGPQGETHFGAGFLHTTETEIKRIILKGDN